MPTHYAGVAADMSALGDVADEFDLWMVEDAAQAIGSERAGAALGTFGDMGALSFHETKNVHCAEGGALLINDPDLVALAEVVQEKGTDRSRFHRGLVDKYTWQAVGSSYVMSELQAAFLWAQLEDCDRILAKRRRLWDMYADALGRREAGNAHIYWLLADDRPVFLARLAERGVVAVPHYVPLHSSPAGVRYGRTHGDMTVTDDVAARLVRLPLWVGMTDAQVEQVVDAVAYATEGRLAA